MHYALGSAALHRSVSLTLISMGLLVKRLHLRLGGNRYAPHWFAFIWRVSLIVLGLVLVIGVLRATRITPSCLCFLLIARLA